ncbi:actin cytoskeleton organization and biogenesis [Paramyrothecium foliicola]|nr:actin cytoskeleton organization and biogenesis [Paramyrothecium foliicola]
MKSGSRHRPLPPDPRRPPCPYAAGFETLMRSHTPPAPLGPWNNKRGQGQQPAPFEQTRSLTHSHSVRLLAQLSCERCTGAKVFRCVVDGNEHQTLVAKIYNPLYYAYLDDVSFVADMHYSIEAAAYQDIWRAGLDGKYTPKYHGSWAIQVLEIDKKLEFAGVLPLDLAPRNVMLVGLDLDRYKSPRIVLFDFNIACCLNRPGARYERVPGNHPMNPLFSHWYGIPADFESWLPQPHCFRPEIWRGWVKRRWYGSPEFMDSKEAEEIFAWLPEHENLPVEF